MHRRARLDPSPAIAICVECRQAAACCTGTCCNPVPVESQTGTTAVPPNAKPRPSPYWACAGGTQAKFFAANSRGLRNRRGAMSRQRFAAFSRTPNKPNSELLRTLAASVKFNEVQSAYWAEPAYWAEQKTKNPANKKRGEPRQ
jgi:hypothetical protein